MRHLFDNISPQVSLDAEAMTAATEGAHVIDTQGFADGMLVVVAGDITCTTGDTYRVKVTESDSSTTGFTDTGIFVDFTGASGSAAGQNTVKKARIPELNVVRKRYLRVDLALTATTTAWEGSGLILLGVANKGPVNSD